MNWNKMKKVFCPKKGTEAWANGNKKGEAVCTACGSPHGMV